MLLFGYFQRCIFRSILWVPKRMVQLMYVVECTHYIKVTVDAGEVRFNSNNKSASSRRD
jgi:hypothetical protein